MELSQMVIQAMWDTDSVFKQLPHFSDEIINRLKSEAPEVETIFDFTEMDNEKRKRVLKGLSNKQIQEIAKVCERYPNIEVNHQVLSMLLHHKHKHTHSFSIRKLKPSISLSHSLTF
jgi:pre-mRNA-splicing helicase BRR2